MEKIPGPAAESEEERRLRLQGEMNFDNMAGRHTFKSDVVAARFAELKLLKDKVETYPKLKDFEEAIYRPDSIYLIPAEKKVEAEEVAKRLFTEYVKRYESAGATIDNVVAWVNTGMPGAASNKMHIYDGENQWNTWALHAIIEDEGTVRRDKYLPKYVVAYHELMHVEETPKGAPRSSEQ